MNQTAINLQAIRKANKTSQEKIAQEMNVSQNVISRIEQGKRKIDLQILEFYADFFKMNIEELLNYHLNKKSASEHLVLEEGTSYENNQNRTIKLLEQYNRQLELRIQDLNYTIELLKSQLKDEQSKVKDLQNKKL